MPDTLTLTPQQIIRKKAAGDPMEPDEAALIHRHIITVLVENTIGAFIRVVNMFSARGFNIESITVGETDNPSISRMNIVTTGNDRIIAQVLRQLNRPDEAATAFEQCLGIDPGDNADRQKRQVECLYYLATLRFRAGNYAETVSMMERVLVANPVHAEARYYLAMSLRRAGRVEEAAVQLELHRKILRHRRTSEPIAKGDDR